MRKKVVVVGAGNVGVHIISAAINKNLPFDFLLVDLNDRLEKAHVLDLRDGALFSNKTTIRNANFGDEDVQDADIVIITAGAKQKEGETRCDLLQKNAHILHSITHNLGSLKSSALVIVASNPVDVLTHLCHSFFDLPASQILGTGTLLDTSRLRWRLAHHFEKKTEDIDGYVLAEHGDSEFVAWSSVSDSAQISEGDKADIESRVRNAAYEIIEGKGATYFGIGAMIAHLLEVIAEERNEIIPLSVFLNGEYGIKNTCLSVPVLFGAHGYTHIDALSLTKEEHIKLTASAEKMKALYDRCPLR